MLLVIGRIGRPHGIRGEVAVEVRTDDPGAAFTVGSVLAAEPAARGPLTIASVRPHGSGLLVRFAGCDDRAQAEQMRDTLLVVDSEDRPRSADPDTFGDHELIGLSVLTTSGQCIGTVADVLHHGQDLLVIRPAGTDAASVEPILVPFVSAIVPDVDVAGGRLVIDPPPGLLDLGAAS